MVVTDFGDAAWDYWFRSQAGAKPSFAGIAINQALESELEKLGERHGVTIDLGRLTRSDGGQAWPVTGRMESFPDVELGRNGFGLYQWATPTVFIQSGSPWATEIQEAEPTELLANGPVATSYQDYGQFTVDGFAVLSAAVLASPPAFVNDVNTVMDIGSYAAVFISGSLAILETVLVAGAAFAVGIRQQQRSLALLSVTGVEPRTLRQITFVNGLQSGVIGAGAGIFLGWAAVRVAIHWAQSRGFVTQDPDYHLLPYLLTAAVVVFSALVAVMIPARMTTKLDAWSAVKGSEVFRQKPSKRLLVAGLVLCSISVLILGTITVWGMIIPTADAFKNFEWFAIAVIGLTLPMLLIGVVLLVGTIFTLIFRVAGQLPVSARLAIREAVRNRGRVAPITAAILVGPALGTAALLNLQVGELAQSGQQHYQLAINQPTAGLVSVQDPKVEAYNARQHLEDQKAFLAQGLITQDEYDRSLAADQDAFEYPTVGDQEQQHAPAIAAHGLPALVSKHRVKSPLPSCSVENDLERTVLVPAYRDDSPCRVDAKGSADVRAETERQVSAWSRPTARICGYRGDPMTHRDQIELVLTDASVLAQVLGRELTANERTQIERGHAVVFDPEYFSADGTVTLYEVGQYEQAETANHSQEQTHSIWGTTIVGNPVGTIKKRVTLPAFMPEGLSATGVYPHLMIPEKALAGTNQTTMFTYVSYEFWAALKKEQVAFINDGLRLRESYFVNPQLNGDESGMQMAAWSVIGLIALGVVTIAVTTTALATDDARVESRVMTVVGAQPRLRRNVAAWQSILAVGIGTLFGVAVGTGPFLIQEAMQNQSVGHLPFLQLVALAVGIPVVAAGLSWLFVPRADRR